MKVDSDPSRAVTRRSGQSVVSLVASGGSTAGRFGFGESDDAKAALGSELVGDLPFSSASLGSLRVHDHVTFTVCQGLEAVDLVAQR